MDYILKQLSVAERIARRNGYAVAIGHPKTGTYQALKQWIETLPDKKLKLVHLSNIVKELNHWHFWVIYYVIKNIFIINLWFYFYEQ